MKIKPLSGWHRRLPLGKPFSWIVFYLLIFEHAPWIPLWARGSILTMLVLIGIVTWASWFDAEDERELLFEDDGTVKWRFAKERSKDDEETTGDKGVQADQV